MRTRTSYPFLDFALQPTPWRCDRAAARIPRPAEGILLGFSNSPASDRGHDSTTVLHGMDRETWENPRTVPELVALVPDRRYVWWSPARRGFGDRSGKTNEDETAVTASRLACAAHWRLGIEPSYATLKGQKTTMTLPGTGHCTCQPLRIADLYREGDPDRKYYLPGEDATVTISADYLFGKPVRNANVRW